MVEEKVKQICKYTQVYRAQGRCGNSAGPSTQRHVMSQNEVQTAGRKPTFEIVYLILETAFRLTARTPTATVGAVLSVLHSNKIKPFLYGRPAIADFDTRPNELHV